MKTPVFCSTVLIVHAGPPVEKAELKRSVYGADIPVSVLHAGTSRIVSRGMLTTVAL